MQEIDPRFDRIWGSDENGQQWLPWKVGQNEIVQRSLKFSDPRNRRSTDIGDSANGD
jgi:hypothetical protein